MSRRRKNVCNVLELRESMSSFRAREGGARWEIVSKSREKTRGQIIQSGSVCVKVLDF